MTVLERVLRGLSGLVTGPNPDACRVCGNVATMHPRGSYPYCSAACMEADADDQADQI